MSWKFNLIPATFTMLALTFACTEAGSQTRSRPSRRRTPAPRPTVTGAPAVKSAALNEKAEELLRRDDYLGVLTLASQSLAFSPGDGVALRLRASAFNNLYEGEKAKADAREAIRLLTNPLDAKQYEARCTAMGILFDKGILIDNLDAHLRDCSEAIRLDPKFAQAYASRGRVYYDKKEYGRAVADFTEAIRLDPKFARAYVYRGRMYAILGEANKAISDYSNAIRLNPKDAMAYNNKGYQYYLKRDWVRALSDYNQAIRLDPKLKLAYVNRAALYEKLGGRAEAKADRDRAAELEKQQ